MSQALSVLIVEDSENDSILLLRQLRKGGYEPAWERVWSAQDLTAALERQSWDIIICDYSMPSFSALDALKIVADKEQDLPFIVVSGAIGEDMAVAAMRAGAHDYLMKDNLVRLAPAIARELHEAKERAQRRQAEEALLQAQKMESLGVLAGGVAHDFNNLLVAMLAQNSLAAAKLLPDHPAQLHIQKAMMAAERAADLTRQMLAYAGQSGTAIVPIDVNEIINENLHLLKATIPNHIQLEARLAKNLPLIQADPGQIQQVIMNLIINAAEAIQEEPGVVHITSAAHEVTGAELFPSLYAGDPPAAGRYVRICVEDTGSGMDEAVLKRIFDPFFTTKKHGRGLGLAAVMGIVHSYEGTIQIESKPEIGTTFHVYIPARQVQSERGEDPAQPMVASQAKATGRVLIIDDEEPVREAVSDILTFVGIETVTAPDGEAGIAIYKERENDISLILLDMSMPGIGGEKTLQELFNINPESKVVLSSGYDQTEAVSHFKALGKISILPKPYDVKTLLHTLAEHGVFATVNID